MYFQGKSVLAKGMIHWINLLTYSIQLFTLINRAQFSFLTYERISRDEGEIKPHYFSLARPLHHFGTSLNYFWPDPCISFLQPLLQFGPTLASVLCNPYFSLARPLLQFGATITSVPMSWQILWQTHSTPTSMWDKVIVWQTFWNMFVLPPKT